MNTSGRIEMNSDYIESIYKVVDYIHKNTNKNLTVKELADIAGFSQFHFHRIFSAYSGETLIYFMKRIRLEKSASQLLYTNANITEIALATGYETPSAYTKAFKQLFDINPSEYKETKNHRCTIQRNVEYGDLLRRLIMENFVGIKEFDDINVVAVRKMGKYSEAACAAWEEVCKFVYGNKIINNESKMIGIGYDNPVITSEENLRYDACITVKNKVKVEGNVFNSTVKGGKYAVFLHKGPYSNLMDTYNAIFSEWIPNNNKKLRDLPVFELYLNRDPRRTKPANLRTEIYVPIE